MNIRFYNGTILTLEDTTADENGCLPLLSGEVWVFDDTIGFVGNPATDKTVSKLHPQIKWDKEINLNGNLIMPGFKDAHTHSAMTFLRSYADD